LRHADKIAWINEFAKKNGAVVDLAGECGFGRECVGLMINETFPDYYWYDDEWDRIDNNGDVWTPENAYHKHPCVAVLGRGEKAESQLYRWLKWFDDNNFKLETIKNENADKLDPIELLLGRAFFYRMVKQEKKESEENNGI